MEMTDNEIRRNYNESKFPDEQIKILAQLNDCTANKIREILGLSAKRCDKPKKIYSDRIKWDDEMDKVIFDMLREGCTRPTIANRLGVPYYAVSNRLQRLALENKIPDGVLVKRKYSKKRRKYERHTEK